MADVTNNDERDDIVAEYADSGYANALSEAIELAALLVRTYSPASHDLICSAARLIRAQRRVIARMQAERGGQ